MTYKLFLGDCLEYMKSMPDKSVVCITDPPYGININKNSKPFGTSFKLSRKEDDGLWDIVIPDKSYFANMFRVSTNQIVFGANYFWEYFHATQCYIIWDKRGNLPKVPFCDTEFAWTSFNKMPKKYTVINHGFIRDSKDIKTGHPTQKPTELFVQILEDFTKKGDTIFDPFMGSGTTGVAAIQLGRNFIGCEIDPDYFAIAEKRIKEATLQPQLFKQETPQELQENLL